MGKLLCCCSRSSTTQPHKQYCFRCRPESYLTQSLPAPSHDSTSQGHRSSEHIQQSSQCNYDKYTQSIVNEETMGNPKLECFIIPFFGKDPPVPGNVAPNSKKASSDFMEGVGNDLTTIIYNYIQSLIVKDNQKELGKVELLCHFKQVKLANFTSLIEDRMIDLKLKSAEYGQKGCKSMDLYEYCPIYLIFIVYIYSDSPGISHPYPEIHPPCSIMKPAMLYCHGFIP